MEFLIDPNIASIFIVAAVMLAFTTIIMPGTGWPEAGMVICLGVTWYEFTHLTPNIWALVIVALSVVPFLIAIRLPRLNLLLMGLTILMVTMGSAYLFIDKDGRPLTLPSAALVSIFCALYIWQGVLRGIRAQGIDPIHDLDVVIGTIGEARTDIHHTGSVMVGGELWTAHSDRPIPEGSQVRVVSREGFRLKVKKFEKLSK
ncbi:MAG TPA: NfeD family protein [Anaerolineales bacterium]|jgi:membrane-bound serine protease (ClpP class)